MKNSNEIEAQILRLDQVLPKLPEIDAFGNKYSDAIAAIKDVLVNNLDEESLLHKYLGVADRSPDFLMNMALRARDWLDGNMDEDLDEQFNETLKLIGT